MVVVEEDELINIPSSSVGRRGGAWWRRQAFRGTGSGCCRGWEECRRGSHARLPQSLDACWTRQIGVDHQGDPVHYLWYTPQGRGGLRVARYSAVALAPAPEAAAGSVPMSWFQEAGFGRWGWQCPHWKYWWHAGRRGWKGP